MYIDYFKCFERKLKGQVILLSFGYIYIYIFLACSKKRMPRLDLSSLFLSSSGGPVILVYMFLLLAESKMLSAQGSV